MKSQFKSSAFAMRGVTLIELIVFIVIVAFVMAALLWTFSGTMRGSSTGKKLTSATQAAQQRMDVILGHVRTLRSTVGYGAINATNYDPCPPVGAWANQACASGSSTVTSSANFTSNVCGAGTGTDCFRITVTATDAVNQLGGSMTLTYQISNY